MWRLTTDSIPTSGPSSGDGVPGPGLALSVVASLLFMVSLPLPGQGQAIEVDEEIGRLFAEHGRAAYLVYFRDRADLSPAHGMGWSERGDFVARALQEAAAGAQWRVVAYLGSTGAELQSFWVDNVIAVESSDRATFEGLLQFPEIAALRAIPEIVLFEPEGASGEPDHEFPFAAATHLARVKAPEVWAMGIEGRGLVVATIDTGVRHTHEALIRQYRGHLGGGSFAHDHHWWDATADRSPVPVDASGHGTHVTGIQVGRDASDAHQIGMAPGAQWLACRACGPDGCSTTGLLECAQFMLAPWDLGGHNPDPQRRPHAVNNSWGTCASFHDPWYQGVVDSWTAAGIVPVFATGDAGRCGLPSPPPYGPVASPARNRDVLGVGSVDAPHSLRGPAERELSPRSPSPLGELSGIKPDIAAPGLDIRSALGTGDGDYGSAGWTGSSMAASHVTGLVALLWQAAPCLVGDSRLTADLVMAFSSRLPCDSGCDDGRGDGLPSPAAGWGEIDALAIVQAGRAACGAPPDLEMRSTSGPIADISPDSFDFEVVAGNVDSDTLNIGNTGDSDLTWSIVSDQFTTAFRSHTVVLDEELSIGSFTVTSPLQGGTPQVFAIPGGVATSGEVIGFTFSGTASGITGSPTLASDTCMKVQAPDGTTFNVGGWDRATAGCGPNQNDADWDFQGAGSTNDGVYTSFHHEVFSPALGDAGTWTFTFVHDFDDEDPTFAVPISWSNVTVKLHKVPTPEPCDDPTSVSWLDVAPASGVTPGGSSVPVEVTVTVDATGLDPGGYEAQLCVTTDDPTRELVIVPVELTVLAPPVADISPISFDFVVIEGDSDSDILNVGNTGGSDLDWSIDLAEPGDGCAVPVAVAWLDVASDAGSTPSSGSVPVDVSVDSTGLPAGAYVALLCITTNDPDATLVVLPVNLTVDEAPPIADISPGSFAFEVVEGDSDSAILTIANLGVAPLTWSAALQEAAGLGGTPSRRATLARRSAANDFEGYFDLANWTFSNDPPETEGSVSSDPGPPVQIFLTGGNDGEEGDSDLSIVIPQDGEVRFDWGYQSSDSDDWDRGGFVVDGDFTVLANNASQVPFFEGSATVAVLGGALFAFRVHTVDGNFGPGVLGVTGFQFALAFCDDPNGVGWLQVDPTSGVISAGEDEAAEVLVDSSGLAPGTYQARLCIETNDPNQTQVVVPVDLTVLAPPVADISPSSFDFEVVEGSSDSATLNVGNTGGSDLDWSIDRAEPGDGCAVPVAVSWLSASPDSETTEPSNSVPVDVAVDTTGLAPGAYQALLCVTTNDPDAALVVVPVTLTVEASVDPDPCQLGASHLVLEDMTLTGIEVLEACLTITAGTGFVVASGAQVTLRAGQTVILGNGVEIEAGASFTIEIDPGLQP